MLFKYSPCMESLQSMCKFLTSKMWLRNFGQIIFIIISVATGDLLQNCVHFEGQSGFVKLLNNPEILKDSVISMEIKTYNCDAIMLTIHNGKNYKLSVDASSIFSDDGNLDKFDIFNSCNGLWHEVQLNFTERNPVLSLGPRKIYKSYDDYKLNELLDTFKDQPLYLGIHSVHDMDKVYDKPFEGFIRNIKLDDQPQSIDPDSLNGTVVITGCPKDLLFSSNMGSVRLIENFNVNDNMRIYFELKITEASTVDKNCSALLVSAHSQEDDYFIVEIVNNVLYMKTKSENKISNVKLQTFLDAVDFCDGNWHKIAVLKQGRDIRIISDNMGYSTDDDVGINFTASLYIGQQPQMAQISAIKSRNAFKGCLTSIHINGVATEINGDDLNEFVQLGNCSM